MKRGPARIGRPGLPRPTITERPRTLMVLAPPVDRLPAYPVSWYLFGRLADLRRRPVAREMLGRRLVAYLTSTGRPVVLDARCSHLGSDLGKGEVLGDSIRCPFHHWQYGPDGRC